MLKKNFPNPPAIRKLTELPQLSPYLNIIKANADSMADPTLWEKNQRLFLTNDVAIMDQSAISSKNSVVVMDFSILQVLVYASIKLQGRVGKDFKKEFDKAFATLPKPDVIVRLRASKETVLKRLSGR